MGRIGEFWVERSKTTRRVATGLVVVSVAFGFSIAVTGTSDSPMWSRILIGLLLGFVSGLGAMMSLWVLLMFGDVVVTGLRRWKGLRDAKRVAYSWVQFGGVSLSELEAVTQTLESARTDREARLLLEYIYQQEEQRSGAKEKKKRRTPMSDAEAEKLTKKWQEETAEQAIRAVMSACIAGEMRAGRSQEEAMRICHAKIAKQLGVDQRG